MKFSHQKLIAFSGAIWLGIGVYLLQLGLNLIFANFNLAPADFQRQLPLISHLSSYVGGKEITAIVLVSLALYVGYMKGCYVLGKSARRIMARIASLPNPAPITAIYGAKYYVLLGSMIALGVSIKYIGLNHDVRGVIDITIGSALVNGAMVYFRAAFCSGKERCNIDKQ